MNIALSSSIKCIFSQDPKYSYDLKFKWSTGFRRKQPSPEPVVKKESVAKPEPSTNGRSNGPSSTPRHASYDETSPISTDYDENDEDNQSGPLDRGYCPCLTSYFGSKSLYCVLAFYLTHMVF